MTICFDWKKKFTYNVFPPLNNGKSVVVELVLVPSVRSTNNAVYSPKRIFDIGTIVDFSIATPIPVNINATSHFVANRNCNFKQQFCFKNVFFLHFNEISQIKLENEKYLPDLDSLLEFHLNRLDKCSSQNSRISLFCK